MSVCYSFCGLASAYEGVNPVNRTNSSSSSCSHYTVGGIEVDFNSETRIKGLFAVGEQRFSGFINGANRL